MSESASRIRWRIVGLVFVVYVLMFIDRVNISIAAKYIMPEYGLTDVEFGWIFSAFVLGYAMVQVPGGWLGDRFGPRRVLTWAIIWWSIFTAVTAIAGDLFLASTIGVVGSFAVIRIFIGLGEAAAPPSANRVIANWMAPQERATAHGIAISGSSLGAALTPPLIVWIMLTWGWRMAFYLAGGVGVVVALLWYRLATDRPANHPGVNRLELAHITRDASSEAGPSDTASRVPWRTLLGRRDLWFLTLGYGVLGYIFYIYFSWFYLYLVNVRGFSMLDGGIYTTAPFLTSAAAAPFGGWLSDWLSQRYSKRVGRCGVGCVCFLAVAGFIYAGAMAEDAYVAIFWLSLGAGALSLSTSSYWAATIDLAEPYAGTVSGFMNMGGNIGGAISPTLTPFLAQRVGWDGALAATAALALIGGLCWLFVHPDDEFEFEKGSQVRS